MATEPLITWSEPVQQLVSFVGTFLVAGAVGFRFTAARTNASAADESAFFDVALRRAALIGSVGAAVGVAFVLIGLPGAAKRAHETVPQLLASDIATLLSLVSSALVFFALGAVVAGKRAGWPVAAVGLLVATLAPLAALRWTAVINPVHRLAGGLWLGSLFLMVTCGLTPLLLNAQLRERRGPLAAGMVNRFSPMALTMGGVVVAFGLITAWRHLPTIPSLWETPYGKTLIIKLAFVAVVFGLGAFNWRRMRPTLGREEGAVAIRRSGRMELSVAAVVLIITSILVSLPSPKRAPVPRPAATAATRAGPP
jgi:putative copper export protein